MTGAIRAIERRLMAWHRADATSQRLESIPGVGIITATALSASVPDPSVFRSGRQFAAFLGLVPRQNSSGGKDRLGRISKMGGGRRLVVTPDGAPWAPWARVDNAMVKALARAFRCGRCWIPACTRRSRI
jgi:hypothetical protein